jgi:hypoxanthine-DNA glycosylase
MSDFVPASASARIASFAPAADANARILILGSVPGTASLAAGQYYAHPHNAFWKIMAVLLGVPHDAPYATRIDAVQRAGIALWDVLHSCVRPGSLDAAIDTHSVRANDIPGLLATCPAIARICFNGSAAEKFFRRHLAASLAQRPIEYVRLPSTSPAHAALRFEHKLAHWRAALLAHDQASAAALAYNLK